MLRCARLAAAIPWLGCVIACGSGGSGDPGGSAGAAQGGAGTGNTAGSGGSAGSLGASSASGGTNANAGSAGAPGGAGKSGAAGNGGSGGGSPVVIGDCDGLGASGTWEKINPPDVKNTQALVLDPFTVGTLWLGASPRGTLGPGQGGVHQSTDCGATFTHVNTGTHGADVDNASIWSLAVDPVVKNVIYVIGAYGPLGLWKSTNGGVDWQQLMTKGSEFETTVPYNFVGSVSMDPNDHLHLVVGTHSDCTGDYAPSCGAETTDGGSSWTLFKTSFMPGWAEQTGPYVIDATTWVYATLFDGLWLTTDRGGSWSDITPADVGGATGGEYTHRPIWQGADGTYYLPSTSKGGLMKSADGKTWSLITGSPSGSYQLGFAIAGGHLYMGDRNGRSYAEASESDTTSWSDLPDSPADTNEGAVFMEYDDAHHLLYSSNFEGGLWRMVTP